MATASIQKMMARTHQRWIGGALLLALLLHGGLIGFLGLYRIAALALPRDRPVDPGPFQLKRVEIDPKNLEANRPDPIARLPVAEPTKSVADFALDPQVIDRALRQPLPVLSVPTLPEPDKVIASAELSPGLPLAATPTAELSADLTRLAPARVHPGVTSAKLADDLISAAPGLPEAGRPASAPATGNGHGTLPGFADLAPNLRAGDPSLKDLPEPVLLRLPSDVLFDFDSATLKPEADSLLSQAVSLIVKYPQAAVQVDGYTDSFGRPDYNTELSRRRAQAVQEWVQARLGSGAYTFRAQGHGSTNYLVAATESIAAQQPNRRVELLIQAIRR